MKKDRSSSVSLRVKFEAGIVILVVLLSVFGLSAYSVTRTITGSGDDVSTFIRNSNGNYWSASGANLQLAIDDMSNSAGTVFVGSDITLTSGITMGENVVLDLQGHNLTASGSSFDIIYMKESSQVKNGVIDVSGITMDDEDACIMFDGIEQISHSNTLVDNMKLISTGQQGAGIRMECDGTNDYIIWTTCRDITTKNFEYGIHINVANGESGNSNFVNGNIFRNIKQYYDKWFLRIDGNVGSYNETNGNIFDAFQCQVGLPTEGIVYNNGSNNMFSFCTWDWQGYGGGNQEYFTAFNITSNANYNYIKYDGISTTAWYINDSGSANIWVDLNKGTIACKYLKPEIY